MNKGFFFVIFLLTGCVLVAFFDVTDGAGITSLIGQWMWQNQQIVGVRHP